MTKSESLFNLDVTIGVREKHATITICFRNFKQVSRLLEAGTTKIGFYWIEVLVRQKILNDFK